MAVRSFRIGSTTSSASSGALLAACRLGLGDIPSGTPTIKLNHKNVASISNINRGVNQGTGGYISFRVNFQTPVSTNRYLTAITFETENNVTASGSTAGFTYAVGLKTTTYCEIIITDDYGYSDSVDVVISFTGLL